MEHVLPHERDTNECANGQTEHGQPDALECLHE